MPESISPPEAVFRDERCASDYDSDRFGGAFGRYLEDQEVRLFQELLDADATQILDAGAGTGKLTLALLRMGRSVISADFSPAMARMALDKAAHERLPAQMVIADVQNLCFAPASFDCVVCSRVLMHVPDWTAAIAGLCRVARRSVIFDFPPTMSVAAMDAMRKRWFRGTFGAYRQPYRTLDTGAVTQVLESHAFRVVARRSAFVLPLSWHRKLDRPERSRAIEAALSALGLRRLFGAPVTLKAVRVG